MAPETQQRRDLPPAQDWLISSHLALEHPSPQRAGAQHKGIAFQVSRSPQWDECWMQNQQLRPRHSQEHSHMPSLDSQALRKKAGNHLEVSLPCFSLAIWTMSEHHHFHFHAGAGVSVPWGRSLRQLCPSLCISVQAQTGTSYHLPHPGLRHAGILQGKTKRLFEDLCSVCKQGLEERRSKKKIGAEFKSMAGRD